jgi:chitinase
MHDFNRSFLSVLLLSILVFTISATPTFGASVSIRWDPNDPAPDGYRVFVRENNQRYNYDHPIYEGDAATCSLIALTEGVTYHFVDESCICW